MNWTRTIISTIAFEDCWRGALLVLLNAFFVAAELALVRIRDTQLEALVAKGDRRAKMARHIVTHIDSYISTTQFGITLASLGLGVAVEPVFRDLLEPVFAVLQHHGGKMSRVASPSASVFL